MGAYAGGLWYAIRNPRQMQLQTIASYSLPVGDGKRGLSRMHTWI